MTLDQVGSIGEIIGDEKVIGVYIEHRGGVHRNRRGFRPCYRLGPKGGPNLGRLP